MYFTDAALHNAFIARSMVGIDETKVEYMLNVIHNLCGRLCFRKRRFVAPVDRDLQAKWLCGSNFTSPTVEGDDEDRPLAICGTRTDGTYASLLRNTGGAIITRRSQGSVVVVAPSPSDPPASEEVMLKHPLLKMVNPDTGKSKGCDRACFVCYRGLNPNHFGEKIRARVFTYCAGCNANEQLTHGGWGTRKKVTTKTDKRIFLHAECYLFHPAHKGFTRIITARDGCSDYEIEARTLRETLREIPDVSRVSLRVGVMVALIHCLCRALWIC